MRLKPLGFGVGQLPVLMALKDGVALTQKRLATLARVEQPSMAQLLMRMQRDGLISRSPDPGDGRSSLISLTALALGQLDGVRGILLLGNEEALTGMTSDEISTLSDLLTRLEQNLRRAELAYLGTRQDASAAGGT